MRPTWLIGVCGLIFPSFYMLYNNTTWSKRRHPSASKLKSSATDIRCLQACISLYDISQIFMGKTLQQQQQQQQQNAYLPQRKAEPVGPHILWPAPTIQSAPSCWTSVGLQGTDWQQSSSTLAPTCRVRQPCGCG